MNKLLNILVSNGFIKRKEVLEAFKKVDRKEFVPDEYKNFAYEDTPLPLRKYATISAPHMHAIYLEESELEEGEKFLEIGFGSGILLAYAYEITKREVYGVEIDEEIFKIGYENLKRTGYLDKCKIFLRDGKLGLKEYAPYDVIVVSAASDKIYDSWIEQLNDDGVLLVPIIENGIQFLYKVVKKNNDVYVKKLMPVFFVSLK